MAKETEEGLETIRRRQAKSGTVSYGDPIILYESSKRRIVLVPFFIPHSDCTELAIKLVTYQKSTPPMDWAVVEQKSISLKEESARKLLEGLRAHFAVAEESEDGAYLVVRVAEGTAAMGTHDPVEVASALVKVLSQEEIAKHVQGSELGTELVSALRGAIRFNEMRSAVAQLREHLENGEAAEEKYQAWCDKHSWAFGNAYVMKDDVRQISTGDTLDILLPTVIAGYRDIVELKRPDMRVLLYDTEHRSYYFSAEVSKAIGQCHRYLDVLHEMAAAGLRDHPEIVAYHPRAIITIGRSCTWTEGELRALHGLNRRLSGVTVMTYDQLLAQGERLVEMLSPQKPSVSPGEDDIDRLEALDEEVPF